MIKVCKFCKKEFQAKDKRARSHNIPIERLKFKQDWLFNNNLTNNIK